MAVTELSLGDGKPTRIPITEITAQISRIEELANEEKGIADLLCVLDVAIQNCGEIPQLVSNISKWIYRHQADLMGTCEAWKKYMNTL